MSESVELAQKAKKSLLTYFSVILLSGVALQVLIATRGSNIDLIAGLGTAAIAVYYFWYNYSANKLLSKVRFTQLVAHLVGFVIINLSYHIHAFILFVNNNEAIKGTSDFSINEGWFGVLFGMTCFWGIGLLIHAFGSILNRGFENS